MKILIAPDSFKGSMTAEEVCDIISRAANEVFENAETVILPVADGGEGTVDAIYAALTADGADLSRAEFITETVRGTLPGTVTRARYLAAGDTAVIEMAEANGLEKVTCPDPLRGSTFGTGELIRDALSRGFRKFLIAIGGSATNDGGCGAMEVLGVRFLDANGNVIRDIDGEHLCDIASIDTGGMDERVAESDFTVLCDVTNPLTGPEGATYVYGPQKGADEEALRILETGMKNYEKVLNDTFGYDAGNVPGAGASGGLGAALLTFLNAETVPGIEKVLEFCGFDEKARDADLIITGEGKIDGQTLKGKAVSGICKRAKELGVPVVAFTGKADIDRKDAEFLGITEVIELQKEGMDAEFSVRFGKELLREAAEEFFRGTVMKDYQEILKGMMPEIINTIKELVAIPSVVSDAEGDMPFGRNVNDALHYMLDTAKRDGFSVFNDRNFGGHIDFPGKGSGVIALVNHLDVVPTGDVNNWESDPFKAEVRGGKLYGRGVLDNKGPLVICYFAMKALKEAGFAPDKTIRLILGCDEETNWFGMEHYMNNVNADIVGGFSADADFPVIHGEKGIVQYRINIPVSDDTYDRIITLCGGTVMNAVPDFAELKIAANPATSGNPAVITVSASGKTAHAAWPDKGENAVSKLFAKLAKTDIDCGELTEFAEFYNEHIGYDVHGTGIGCGFEDEPSGKLSFNVSKIEKYDDTESSDGRCIRLGVDIRYPVTMTENDVRRGIESVIGPYGYSLGLIKDEGPLYIPKEDPLVTTLMNIYRECTGDTKAEPIVIGGGTYARAVRNTVAFGPVMPGECDMCHLPNEYMELSQIEKAAEIYSRAIYELSC